jgi:hypothetical protein
MTSGRLCSHVAAAALLAAALPLVACGKPRTDIVATVTEDVGTFYVRSSDSGGRFVGQVCVDQKRHADEIVTRILQQLANHNYQTITLDVYSGGATLGRYVWTPGGAERQSSPSNDNPCGNADRS